jgi:methylenetetrahydrofolate dehydrogenase (NADP+)/methenyltetrahydrofolate cyclohydrolase
VGVQTRPLRGKAVRDDVLAQLKSKVERCARPPGLAVVLVGEDPASAVYVRQKEKACAEIGFQQTTLRYPATTPELELLSAITRLNADPDVDGILIQLPLPEHLPAAKILNAVDPRKDVDGFHPVNLGRLVAGCPRFVPCTPKGILRLLDHYGIPRAGRHVVIVGRSVIVGRPLALLLSLKRPDANATVTLCHSGTRDLPGVVRRADIVVAAVGSPALLTREHVPQGAVVIDVGINRIPDSGTSSGTRLAGDVAPEALEGWASSYTPVPGGIGPMTIAMLLENTWEAMTGEAEP